MAPGHLTRRTIPNVILAAAARHGDALAVVEARRRATFAEVETLMRRAAAAFIRAGVKKGDRVALWAQNGLDWIVACAGAQAAGAVVVPLSTRFKGAEVEHVLNKSRARFLVAVRRFVGVDFAEMLKGHDLPYLKQTVWLDSDELKTGEWDAFLADAEASPETGQELEKRLAALSEDDASDIIFTSGTTGEPKGVLTSHGQNIRTYEGWTGRTGLRTGDRYLVIWPFFHCAGYKSGWLSSFIVGATLYPETTLDVPRLIGKVAREKITVLPGPPTLFQSLLVSPEAKSGALSSLRVAVTGASVVPPSLIESMRNDLGIKAVFNGYGLTETCGTVSITDGDDPAEIIVTSVGKAIDGVAIRCVGPDGADMPLGQPGEVIVRGYNVMQGYLDDPEATAANIDKEGWLHTGDVGTLDERGYLRITDRLKDMFIVGGFNCYPAEIEKIMLRNDSIHQVAVIGMPDPRMGEVGKAFVVLKPGASATPQEIIAWSRDEMANYKVPREVAIVDALPLNATGKVQKFKL